MQKAVYIAWKYDDMFTCTRAKRISFLTLPLSSLQSLIRSCEVTQRASWLWLRRWATGWSVRDGRRSSMEPSQFKSVSYMHAIHKSFHDIPNPYCMCAVSVWFSTSQMEFTVARKIQYRADNAVVIQRCVRMYLALHKHRPRYCTCFIR